MKLIFLLLKTGGREFAFAVLGSILSGVSSVGIIATINQAIAQLPTVQAGLFGVFVAFCLSLWICQFLSWVLIIRLSQKVIRNLRVDISKRLLNCPLQHLEYLGKPKLMATLLEDINAISEASTNLALLFVNISILVGICLYLCWLSPQVFAIILLFIILGFTLYNLMRRPGIKSFKLARQVSDVLFGHFRSVTEGTKELQLNRQRRQAFFETDLKASATQAMHYWTKGSMAFAFAGSSGIVIVVFIPVGWLVFFLAQSNAAAAALAPSYVLAILYLFTPLGDITNSLPAIARASIALEKVESLGLSLLENSIELTSSLETSPEPACLQDWKRLTLMDIQHAYRGANDAHSFELREINLTFERGEIVFLVGGNGSGKSTLAKLITGLYIPDSGRILVDNRGVNDHNREEYRQLFSAIFQDFYLFERFLGIHPNQLQYVNRYLDALALSNKVSVIDGRLSTMQLSQGQRKRLALLTTYLEDRLIYVFDEWASDQDPVFKEVFYRKLLPDLKQKGKTVIAISHDDRYFDACDHLVKLEFGRIIGEKAIRPVRNIN